MKAVRIRTTNATMVLAILLVTQTQSLHAQPMAVVVEAFSAEIAVAASGSATRATVASMIGASALTTTQRSLFASQLLQASSSAARAGIVSAVTAHWSDLLTPGSFAELQRGGLASPTVKQLFIHNHIGRAWLDPTARRQIEERSPLAAMALAELDEERARSILAWPPPQLDLHYLPQSSIEPLLEVVTEFVATEQAVREWLSDARDRNRRRWYAFLAADELIPETRVASAFRDAREAGVFEAVAGQRLLGFVLSESFIGSEELRSQAAGGNVEQWGQAWGRAYSRLSSTAKGRMISGLAQRLERTVRAGPRPSDVAAAITRELDPSYRPAPITARRPSIDPAILARLFATASQLGLDAELIATARASEQQLQTVLGASVLGEDLAPLLDSPNRDAVEALLRFVVALRTSVRSRSWPKARQAAEDWLRHSMDIGPEDARARLRSLVGCGALSRKFEPAAL